MPIVIGVHPQSHKSHTKKLSEISPMINEHLNLGHWQLGGNRKFFYFTSGSHSIHKVTIYKVISPLRTLGIPPTFLSLDGIMGGPRWQIFHIGPSDNLGPSFVFSVGQNPSVTSSNLSIPESTIQQSRTPESWPTAPKNPFMATRTCDWV